MKVTIDTDEKVLAISEPTNISELWGFVSKTFADPEQYKVSFNANDDSLSKVVSSPPLPPMQRSLSSEVVNYDKNVNKAKVTPFEETNVNSLDNLPDMNDKTFLDNLFKRSVKDR